MSAGAWLPLPEGYRAIWVYEEDGDYTSLPIVGVYTSDLRGHCPVVFDSDGFEPADDAHWYLGPDEQMDLRTLQAAAARRDRRKGSTG